MIASRRSHRHFTGRPSFRAAHRTSLMLGILPALGAEGAADVSRDDADPLLGDVEDATGQHLADPMRVLDVRMERVAILAGVVDAEGAARLHVLGVHPADRRSGG